MFYIKDNDKIVLYDEDRQKLEKTLEFLPQYAGLEIQEVPNGYIIVDFELITEEQAEERQQQKEQERVNNLTMTPLDFIKILISLGLTLEQVNAFLESNLNIKMQLTYCNSVYCGVVKSFLPIEINGITITSEMIEQAFKLKNGG